MRRLFYLALATVLAATYVQLVLDGPRRDPAAPAGRPAGAAPAGGAEAPALLPDPAADRRLPAWTDPWESGLEPGTTAEADSLLAVAAARAWAFTVRNYNPATGLVNAHDEYRFVTMWDVASALAAYYSAGRLGLTDAQDYRDRAGRALRTLASAPLFEDGLFNKVYDAATGTAVDADTEPTQSGYGWSAVDMGRLLVWLRILREGDPDLTALVDSVVARLDPAAAVRDGVLLGRERGPILGTRTYQEGRIGYEQYGARGFALWGAPAATASDAFANAAIDSVYGRPVPRDVRGDDCLTSEPLILAGMEFGWDADWGELARAALEAQYARYLATDTVTIVSEDASSQPPHYFYYYCVSADGRAYAVHARGEAGPLAGPRAVSAKAALAWYALAPSPYTALAVRTVAAGARDGAWPAGVLEGTDRPSGGENVNTAGVILEAALYAAGQLPFLRSAAAGAAGTPSGDLP